MTGLVIAIWLIVATTGQPLGQVRSAQPMPSATCEQIIDDPEQLGQVAAVAAQNAPDTEFDIVGFCHPVDTEPGDPA
jgi:hypothetical protein